MADVSIPSGGSLATAYRQLGRPRVLYCEWWDGTTDIVLSHLGDTKGEVKGVDPKSDYDVHTAPETTGGAVLDAWERNGDPEGTIPLYLADPALRPIITPTGGSGGAGRTRRKRVKPWTLVFFPEEIFTKADGEIGTAITYAKAGGGVWKLDGVAFTAEQLRLLDRVLWAWKIFFTRPPVTFKMGDGDDYVESVGFRYMLDVTKPEGEMLFTIGDPADVGIDIDPVV